MAIFSSGESLRNEGIQNLNLNQYERACRCFAKAIEKQDYASIILLADAKWERGAKTEAIQLLLEHESNSDVPREIKISIYKKLMHFDGINYKIYQYRAACLGDFIAMKHEFECNRDKAPEVSAEWLEKLLKHEECDRIAYFELQNDFERAFHAYSVKKYNDSCHYIPQNEIIGNFNRSDLLKIISEGEYIADGRKGQALCELGRGLLVDRIIFWDQGKYKVEYYNKNASGAYYYFRKACDYKYLPAYYYMGVLLSLGIDCKKNTQEAKYYLDKLFEDENKLEYSGLFDNIRYEDIYAFRDFIWSKEELRFYQEKMNKVIGHHAFKEKIKKEAEMVHKRYDSFMYSRERCCSEFQSVECPKRKIQHKIFIMNGNPSNCKKTMTEHYVYILNQLYKTYRHYTGYKFIELKTVDIDSIGGLENKIDYVRKYLTDYEGEHAFKYIYFDQPYNIVDPNGENYYHIIMKNLVREVLQSDDKILFLAGDGDTVLDELKALGIREYHYIDDMIAFNGYSEDEVLQILPTLNPQSKIDYGPEVYREIHKIVKVRNQQFPANIDYDEIKDISNILGNVYFSTEPEYRQDILNYKEAFDKIQSRLRIEKISESTMKEAIAELESLTGLRNIKEEVYKIIDTVRINNIRKEMGLQPMFHSMHMVFYGNPGTGKTTVARLMGKILKELGVLEKGHLVEKSRGDLVSQYFGATAGKTKEILRQAVNGVLFIDEAYTLTNGQGGNIKDYGQEAIEEILKFMSDKAGQIVVIVAGYKDEMERFLKSNPGLESRFNTKLEFENYTEEELYEIFERLCKKNDFDIETGSKPYILKYFEKIISKDSKSFGNARFVNQYFTQIAKLRSKELAQNIDMNGEYSFTKEELRLLPTDLFKKYQFRE